MPPISADPKFSPRNVHQAADQEALRAAARAGYEGRAAQQVPGAMKQREDRRAEREREAHRRHYLGASQKLR